MNKRKKKKKKVASFSIALSSTTTIITKTIVFRSTFAVAKAVINIRPLKYIGHSDKKYIYIYIYNKKIKERKKKS
jgi:hypothetical protein